MKSNKRAHIRDWLRRSLALLLALVMVVTMLSLKVFADDFLYDHMDKEKSGFINKFLVNPAKPEEGKTAADLIKSPNQPKIYTLRTDYMVPKGEEWKINYQPYVAGIAENASDDEKEKVDKVIELPELNGYVKPQENYRVTYDPKESITRPDGYVRATFEAETGLKLTEQKAYYVKANAGITLGDRDLVKPGYEAQTGYKFDKWDKEDTTTITDADIVVTAKATKLDKVIPVKDGEGNPNEKPEGYKEVTFVIKTEDAAKGSITGVAKFFVNPTEYVTINPPSTKANTGYEFGAWSQDATIPTVYDEDTTITGSSNGLKDVIPKTKDDESEKPEGYVKVTFIVAPQGYIPSGETKVYYVNPKSEVTITPPEAKGNTGFKFDTWDKDTTKKRKYEKDTTVTGTFRKLADINKGGPDVPIPKGYVTVNFYKGKEGKTITGQTVYYVNPKAKKKFGDITKPTVTPEIGWKFINWPVNDTFKIDTDIKATALYESIDDVVPKDNPEGGENEKPDGYIAVTFSTEENGKIKDSDKTEKVVYVNPNKAVVLKGQDPDVMPNTGYEFAGWDTQIDKKIQYSEGNTIKALYNEKDDVILQEKPDGSDKPTGYLTVTFNKGDHGELSGTTVYYVKPNKQVTVPAPTVTPATGYEHKGWDKALTQTFTAENTIITARYSAIPYDPSVTTDLVVTQINKQPTKGDYAKKINANGEEFTVTGIVKKPDVSKSGMSEAEVEIKFANGVTKTVRVKVYVEPDPKIVEKPYPVPGDCNNSCEQPNVGKDALNTTDHYQYLIGYPDGTFGPNKGMTRAEVATMFTRLLKERPVKWQHYNAGLTDIHAGDWYADIVGYAVQKGIVSGYPDGSFKPNQPITRAEFASIASRFDALTQGQDIAFSDLAPSHWGYNAIRSAASKGWISGYPDNTFRPEQAITRAEVTSVTNRMLNRYADLYWIDAHRADIIRFSDVKRSDWYFEPIMEATMGHDFIRDRDKKTEHWTGLNGKSFI